MASSFTNCTPIRKLKDSCDLCSASKLRCNKQKPTCTRCAALNQPCSYSPARRAGRPHRVREKSQQQSLDVTVESTMQPAGDSDQSSDLSLGTAAFLGVQSQRHDRNNEQRHQQQPPEPLSRQVSVPIHDTREDCTRVAIYILEQLDLARRQSGLANVSSATTDACQRLLTILVCPCSEQPGVALLVACGCISLMDTVHHCHVAQGTSIPELPNSTTTTPATEKDIPGWPRSSSSHSSHGGMEQLAKIAKLILQFTDRYAQEPKGGTGWAQTTWLVAPIAALLRFRLQSVTHQAAKRLVF
ncbi:uncharacterized protein TRIVIDRAFT_49693 [Trichoderma virens Gv29-8]|uniref:Zn(2)-C6 fungal-type domain-containing protein n=1 Tax=Hypocrea virens (strain Gv29-8 / FGSC 10586) TaxID=413071 RepID=G9MXN7_HYPVG|nr:uncharacterized protein TRIVIDRAFT_49693 [Trichoderma virens Gv29-8]EHK20649.1 hypothetical protein TRIVIDRAFT_49693 [Trichoderma virens Gv29-8]